MRILLTYAFKTLILDDNHCMNDCGKVCINDQGIKTWLR